MSSDAGVMLLSEVDRKFGLTRGAARHITDPRDPLRITHGVRRHAAPTHLWFGTAGEDLNDHAALRQDMAMQTAIGVERDVASAPPCAAWRTGLSAKRFGVCTKCWLTTHRQFQKCS